MPNIFPCAPLLSTLMFLPLTIQLLPAQNTDSLASQKSIFDLLPENQIAEVIIETDYKLLEANRKKDIYQPGHIQIIVRKNKVLDIDMKIKSRGRFRRMKCDFPPLKLKFKKSDLQERGLNEMNELKLVTHCLNDRAQSRELVVREYLMYKLYEILSNYHFKVRLVKVRYEGREKKLSQIKHYSILLEDGEDLAKRYQAVKYELMGVSPDSLHRFQEITTSMFQYLISNTDYSYTMLRNVELVKLPNGRIVCIPYDFDFSCVVNAPYAKPNTSLGQESICQRVYLGFPGTPAEVEPVLRFFEKKKEELIDYVHTFKTLPVSSREEIINYLQSFYDEIQDRDHILQVVQNSKGILNER